MRCVILVSTDYRCQSLCGQIRLSSAVFDPLSGRSLICSTLHNVLVWTVDNFEILWRGSCLLIVGEGHDWVICDFVFLQNRIIISHMLVFSVYNRPLSRHYIVVTGHDSNQKTSIGRVFEFHLWQRLLVVAIKKFASIVVRILRWSTTTAVAFNLECMSPLLLVELPLPWK